MRLQLIYAARNLLRNPLRTLLTCAAVGLPIIIFVLATAVVDGIQQFLDNASRQMRLAVTQKASIVNPLPAGHRAKIEALDPARTHLLTVCCFRWLGGKIANDPRPLSTVAADPDTFPATFSEHRLTAAERAAWRRDRQALVVGRGTAAQFGWNVGDRVTIQPSVPPYTPMQFHVISTAPDAADPITIFCRRDYVEEEIKRGGWLQDLVSFIFVKCATLGDLDYYRTAIDQLFANTPDETFTQDEKSFMSQFITQQFDLPRNLSLLALMTVIVAVLAATNTMSMNFRDRLSEYATLRAIGYPGLRILSLLQLESLVVCLVGGGLGALGPYLAFTATPLKDFTVPLIQHLEIRPLVCGYAIGIAALVGVLAAAWPSWLAVRLKVLDAFRLLE